MEVLLDFIFPSQQELPIKVFVGQVMDQEIGNRHRRQRNVDKNKIVFDLQLPYLTPLFKLLDANQAFDPKE